MMKQDLRRDGSTKLRELIPQEREKESYNYKFFYCL